MPKFGTHILIAELAQQRYPATIGPLNNALRLGAIGPDLTLLLMDPFATQPWVQDTYSSVIRILKFRRDVMDRFKEIEDQFSKLTGTPAQDMADWLSGGLSKDLIAIAESSLEAIILSAELGVAHAASSLKFDNPLFGLVQEGLLRPDLLSKPEFLAKFISLKNIDRFGFPFRYFGHPLTDDPNYGKVPYETGNYSKWWWMDMLHYRKPVTFARELIGGANSDLLKSYSIGYMSHVAGDIVGHPIINSIVGGPFRNHAYRHMVLESLADTWLWDYGRKADVASANLDKLIDLKQDEREEICRHLITTMKSVYQYPMRPDLLQGVGAGYPTMDHLMAAMTALTEYLHLSTGDTTSRPGPPPDDPKEVIIEMQKLLEKYDPSSSGPPNWNPHAPWDYLALLFGYFFRGLVFILMIATAPLALMLRLTLASWRWVLYFIHLGIYMIISAQRSMLALMGWAYASREDFSTFPWLEDLIRTGSNSDELYPTGVDTRNPKPPYYWLISPQSLAGVEQPITVATIVGGGALPSAIIDPGNKINITEHLKALLSAHSPSATIKAERQMVASGESGLGNAPDLVEFMLQNATFPDLDLDGDRGYAFKPWQGLPPNGSYIP